MSIHYNEFVDSDNANRLPEYKKSTSIENTLSEMNVALSLNEHYIDNLPERSSLFIYGLPRSGTTLLYQLLTNCLDVGYINNLIARFWKAPLTGIALSQSLSLSSQLNFSSDYGKTEEITGPHEFSYFWHELLDLKTEEDIVNFGLAVDNTFPKNKIRKAVTNIQQAFKKSIVFKAMEVGNNPSFFLSELNKSLFVYIKRDASDVALSIFRARKKYYSNIRQWWGTYPRNFKEVKQLSVEEQIAYQVLGLIKMYDEGIAKIPENNKLILDYKDLCDFPKDLISSIQDKVKAISAEDLLLKNPPPHAFRYRTYKDATLTREDTVLLDTLHAIEQDFCREDCYTSA